MSASCLRIFMLGIKIPADRLATRKRERGCDHELADLQRAKFCSECGSPVWTLWEEREFYDSDKIGKFTIRTRNEWIKPVHNERAERHEVAYVGIEINGDYVNVHELHAYWSRSHVIKAEIGDELTKHNIRFDDECPFGLHLVAELC
jgi:hypothetical protein